MIQTGYTITYNANGGNGTMTATRGTNPQVVTSTFTAPEGYEFAGWNTSADGTGTNVAVGTTLSANVTLYAQWTSLLPAGWDSTKVASTVNGTITVDSNANVSVTAPIPTGYTVSDIEGENTIAGGLVIYQGTDPVSTDEDAITTRNQFVWIPVTNINSMIMCKSNEEGSVCDIELSNGELHCKTHGTTGATNMCGRLYRNQSRTSSSSSPYIYSTSMDFTLTTQEFSDNYREPDIVSGDQYHHGLESTEAFLSQLQGDFYAMAKSVALYKGFYIARYEAGYDSTKYTSKKGQVVMIARNVPDEGAYMWYGQYNHLRTFAGDTNHPMGVLNSQMIWGCQYDQAIKFIKQNSVNPELDPEIGHSGIGLKTTSKDASGAVALDIMKNIYDLEGNCYDLTAEAGGDSRVKRGSYYQLAYYGSFKPASDRSYSDATASNEYDSSRSGLYL